MPRIRIPVAQFRAKDKHKYIPKGQREVSMIFASEVIFIDTEYLPGHEPEPEPEPTPVIEEPVEEEKAVGPTLDWSKKKLIRHAKKLGIYTKKMEGRSFTKAKILKTINKHS